ncbi:MAG: hypothetical protein ACKVJU_08545 [Verrucomicrobiales bacterium]
MKSRRDAVSRRNMLRVVGTTLVLKPGRRLRVPDGAPMCNLLLGVAQRMSVVKIVSETIPQA